MSFSDLFTADETELAEHYPSRAERVADAIVHAVGLLAAAVGAGALFAFALIKGGAALMPALAAYAACLMAMLACSAVYNLARPSAARRVLRRLDEAAIFLMIAGSYTPFALQLMPPSAAYMATGVVWAAAFAGAAGKVLWPQISDRAWCIVYLAFAWAGVAFMAPAAQGLPMAATILLAAGGLLYSGGVLVYLSPRMPYRRAIWHAIVVLGAALHYSEILTGVLQVM